MKFQQFSKALFVTLPLFLTTSAQAGDTATSPGEKAYRSYCAACHGADAKGNGPVAPNLITKPADLTQLSVRNNNSFPREKLITFIDGRKMLKAHGSREMPIWGTVFSLQAQEEGILQNDRKGIENSILKKINQLVDYLETRQLP